MSHGFTVVSLFAGCGGSSTGYALAGGKVLLAIEWDDNAADVYRLNHPDTVLLKRDIAHVSVDEVLEATGLAVGELGILDGSPPCQGFSTAGKRQVDDARNQLFTEYVRLLNGLQPKVFVFENVSGMAKGRMRPLFLEVVNALRACGYKVEGRLMNARHYGVPQSRERVILIGVRNNLPVTPSFPKPATGPVTLRQAVAGLGEQLEALRPKGVALQMALCLKAGESGAKLRKQFGAKIRDFSLQRLHWDKVAPTICKTVRPGQCGLLHPDETRYLSTAELKRLASFPDDYRFTGSLEEQWARIGNSVPPLLMKAIAGHMATHVLAKSEL